MAGGRPVQFAPFHIVPGAVSAELCNAVDAVAASLPANAALFASGSRPLAHESIRKAAIRWIFPASAPALLLFARIDEILRAANDAFWQFDLAGADTPLQHTDYAEIGAHYDWHMDWGAGEGLARKLSVSIQLRDGASYEGGDLEFMSYPMTESGRAMARARGTAIVFPSFLQHRVTPIRRGQRRSIVTWRCGDRPYQ